MIIRIQTRLGVTIIGLLLLVGLGLATICGSLYVARKALAAGQRIQDAHDAALSNAVSVVEKMAAHQNEDLFIDTPGAVWTELTNAPGWWKVEIPDEEYAAALAEPQLWAILEATELAGPWTDTGRREPGNGASVQQLLRDQVRYEGPQASHDFGPMRFYRRVLPSEVPPPLEEK